HLRIAEAVAEQATGDPCQGAQRPTVEERAAARIDRVLRVDRLDVTVSPDRAGRIRRRAARPVGAVEARGDVRVRGDRGAASTALSGPAGLRREPGASVRRSFRAREFTGVQWQETKRG